MHPDVLTDKDCENVYELVYSSSRAVAGAAGEFLNVRLFRSDEPPAPARSRRGKARLPNTPLIRDLVQFFIESEVPSAFCPRSARALPARGSCCALTNRDCICSYTNMALTWSTRSSSPIP